MSASEPSPATRVPRTRWVLVAVLALLVGAVGCGYGLGLLGVGESAASGAAVPTVTGAVPTVTVTATATEQAQPGSAESVAPPSVAPRPSSSAVAGSGTAGSGGAPAGSGTAFAGTGRGMVDAGSGRPFTMTATVVGGPLVIGQPRSLRVTVTNPNRKAITLGSVTVRVGTPSRAGCRAAWLSVGRYAGAPTLGVAAQRSAVLVLPIQLVDLPGTDQNACQRATFPLSLSGTAGS